MKIVSHYDPSKVLMEIDCESLRGANLSRANLSRADLHEADLHEADLHEANLSRADLYEADLHEADLHEADLRGADLSRADLSRADLRGADLRGANLPYGEKWETYLAECIPALLTASGKKIEDVIATKCWECHSWDNCPMHIVFGINSSNEGPILLRPRIEQFIQFFDAELIPCPIVEKSR